MSHREWQRAERRNPRPDTLWGGVGLNRNKSVSATDLSDVEYGEVSGAERRGSAGVVRDRTAGLSDDFADDLRNHGTVRAHHDGYRFAQSGCDEIGNPVAILRPFVLRNFS